MSVARLQPVRWEGELEDGYVWMLDQRRLPAEEVALRLGAHGEVADAIREMAVRGAPAIGVSAAFGAVLAAREAARLPADERGAYFRAAVAQLAATRPTAVNLFWALRRMERTWTEHNSAPANATAHALFREALAIQAEDTEANLAMGRFGAALLPDAARVLTHCNTGALATSSYGTALGVVRAAWEQGKLRHVLADETRPFLQGSRLTAWELQKDGIPVTLITDSMAGFLMKRGEVDCVIVGADRIARNGDVANKIGTYSLAVLARAHGVPFYVAAPTSTIDLETPDGDAIPIEERSADEVTHLAGHRIAPEGVGVRHPAFDVTPAGLIAAVITERGVASPPNEASIGQLMRT